MADPRSLASALLQSDRPQWVVLMLPTIGGHLERSTVLRMEVLHGTPTSQAWHAWVQAEGGPAGL